MTTIRNIDITIEQSKFGQMSAYRDEEYEYVITSQLPAEIVKEICTKYIMPREYSYEQYNNGECSHFAGYYLFEELEKGKYRYYVRIPNCD